MRILRHDSPSFRDEIKVLSRRAVASLEVAEAVREILAAVRDQGDLAVLEYTAKFDGPRIKPSGMRVSRGRSRQR